MFGFAVKEDRVTDEVQAHEWGRVAGEGEMPAKLVRAGPLLIFTRGAILPARCVKCNAPGAGGPIKQGLVTSAIEHPHGLIGAAIHVSTRRSTHVRYYLCQTHRRLRFAVALLGSTLTVASAGLFLCGTLYRSEHERFLQGVGFAAMVLAILILRKWEVATLKARHIEDDLVSVTGAGRPFLDSIRPE